MKKTIEKPNNKTVVKTYKELFHIVQKSIEQYNEVRLENSQIPILLCRSYFLVSLHRAIFLPCQSSSKLGFGHWAYRKRGAS